MTYIVLKAPLNSNQPTLPTYLACHSTDPSHQRLEPPLPRTIVRLVN